MLFAITGTLKPGGDALLPALQEAFNEHLAQPYRHIRLAGMTRGPDGHRTGFMVLLEADSFADAEAYLHESPLFQAGAYARTEVAEYVLEVGHVG
ncbi:MAG TPA: YciI family protein [Allosphingosinicella sp.]|jgi:uncharacterized protein YciI